MFLLTYVLHGRCSIQILTSFILGYVLITGPVFYVCSFSRLFISTMSITMVHPPLSCPSLWVQFIFIFLKNVFWVFIFFFGFFYFNKLCFLHNLKLGDSSRSVCLKSPSPHNHALFRRFGHDPKERPEQLSPFR